MPVAKYSKQEYGRSDLIVFKNSSLIQFQYV